MINITRFRKADNRMDEDIRLAGAGGADSEFPVGAMHGVAGLKGDDAGPAQFLEMDAEFGGGVAQGDVVVLVKAADGGDGAPNVVFAGGGVQVFDGWVFGVAAEDRVGFFFSMKYIIIRPMRFVSLGITYLSGL